MKTVFILLATLLLAPLAVLHAEDSSSRKPNVILFLVDDMGWMDCGAYGSRYYKTPHIDAFAKQSMRFTDAYSMPLCSPTRASILSGQYSSRHGITSADGHKKPMKATLQAQAAPNAPLLMPESGTFLDPAQYTLAEALRDAGYRTAHIGKWHLGLTEPHWPEAQGFDVAFHCHPDPGPPGGYFSPYDVLPPGSERPKDKNAKYVLGNITDGPAGEYIVDRQAAEAEKFIEASKDRPFFLNLWCYGVHGPWGHKQDYTAEFAQTNDPRGVQGNPIMASMLRSVDECFGRILTKLDALGLAENTIVIFTSDNGGNDHTNSGEDAKMQKRTADDPFLKDWRKWAGDKPPTSNAPLRSGKGKLYEGGTRVPLMVRWPGKIARDTIRDAVVGCIDIYPTVLDLAGIPLPNQQKFDGVSYAPVLRGKGSLNRDAYFIWFPHLIPGVSVRQGDWKLIRRFTERPADYEGVHELYHLKEDLGETRNLAAQMPEKVNALNALIDAFVQNTGALYPQPNPAYNPRAVKLQPAEATLASDQTLGLVPRFCTLSLAAGAARMQADGRTPFLGTSQVKATGPFQLKLRARSATGGPGKVQWITEEQTEFPKTGQTAEFSLPAGDDWQDVTVDIPLNGKSRIIRLYLPADQSPVEIASIRYSDNNGTLKAWSFNSKNK
jgi:arylsulfatase A-like enzyme